MGAPKRVNASITLKTKLSPAEVLSVSQEAAAAAKSDLWTGGLNHVRYEGGESERLNFSVRTMKDRWELMTFCLDVTRDRDSLSLTSRIQSYKTTQATLFYFIPVGPKEITGFVSYKVFMKLLLDRIKVADPTASGEIRMS